MMTREKNRQLTREQVLVARAECADGKPVRAIADEIGLSKESTRQMLDGTSYRDIPGHVRLRGLQEKRRLYRMRQEGTNPMPNTPLVREVLAGFREDPEFIQAAARRAYQAMIDRSLLRYLDVPREAFTWDEQTDELREDWLAAILAALTDDAETARVVGSC